MEYRVASKIEVNLLIVSPLHVACLKVSLNYRTTIYTSRSLGEAPSVALDDTVAVDVHIHQRHASLLSRKPTS
jgi:hypothetical protein